MTIILELAPEVESRLLAQTQAKGVSIHDYVEQIVEQQASQSASEPAPAPQANSLYDLFSPVRGLLTDEEVDTPERCDAQFEGL